MTCKSTEWLQSRERYYFRIQLSCERTPLQAPACSASPLLSSGRQALLRQGFTEQPEGEQAHGTHRTSRAGWDPRGSSSPAAAAKLPSCEWRWLWTARLCRLAVVWHRKASALLLQELNLDFHSC